MTLQNYFSARVHCATFCFRSLSLFVCVTLVPEPRFRPFLIFPEGSKVQAETTVDDDVGCDD